MLAAVLVLYLKGMGSYRDLSHFLAKKWSMARKCSFHDRTPDQSSFSRFLSSPDDRMLESINRILVEELRRAGVMGDRGRTGQEDCKRARLSSSGGETIP